MALNRLLLLSLFLLVLVPNSVFGVTDVENKDIIAESQNGEIVLSLEFGENQYSRFDRIIPTLQSGLLVLGDSIVEIKDARTKIMGNSFVVHSENILIYAKGIGNENYLINSYLLGSNQLDPIRLETFPTQDATTGIEENVKPVEMIVLVQQNFRTFWNENYNIAIKVFDKEINPNPQFYQSFGAINQAEIEVTLKDLDGEKITNLTGQTNSKGFWNGSVFVNQNLAAGGKYMVEVDVTYLDSNNFQKFETFVVADSRSAKG
jgi:hypothetical protein